MTDKWTMGSNNEGLYNGINPSCERKKERRKRKEKGRDQETTTVAPKEQPKGIHIIQDQTPRI